MTGDYSVLPGAVHMSMTDDQGVLPGVAHVYDW